MTYAVQYNQLDHDQSSSTVGRRSLLRLSLFLLAMAFCSPAMAEKEEETEEPEVPPRHAYKLGDFRIKNFRPVEREKVTMKFTVYVEVEDEKHEQFENVWKSREHRIRNQIITSSRLVPPDQFDDPTLHALRRRIYLRLRRAVPELPVDKVYISDFSYVLE